MAEEENIVFDSVKCFSQWGFQKGVKTSRFIE